MTELPKGTWCFTGDYIAEAEETLQILASIYSDRPGYDPSWTVD